MMGTGQTALSIDANVIVQVRILLIGRNLKNGQRLFLTHSVIRCITGLILNLKQRLALIRF